MSVLVDIAEAVKDYLKQQKLSVPVNVSRRHVYNYDQKALQSAQVSIIPAGISNPGDSSRSSSGKFYTVRVAVQKVYTSQTQASEEELDQLWSVTEQVVEHLEPVLGTNPVKMAGATWQETGESTTDTDRINDMNVFSVVTNFIYTFWR